METTYINKKTLIGEIVNRYPETAEVLLGIGMHCLGCPASQAESLVPGNGGGAARNRYALPRLSGFPGGES